MDRLILPPPFRGVFFDRLWETSRLWTLPTARTPMLVADLEWHLQLPVWSTVPGEPRFDLSPAVVVSRREVYARHWAKILAADLSDALELFRNGDR